MLMKNPMALEALVALLIFEQYTLLSVVFEVPPHPQALNGVSALVPYWALAMVVAVTAILLGLTNTRLGRLFCVLAALLALLPSGPQKYFDYQFFLLWPSIIGAQVAIVTLLVQVVKGHMRDA